MRLEPVLHPVTSLEATSFQERKDIKKKTKRKNHRYFINF